MALNPRWHYRIYGTSANLTRGIFNACYTGIWLGNENSLPADVIEVEMEACPKCDDGSPWVTVTELQEMDGVLECEHCGKMLKPWEAERAWTKQAA